MPKRVLGVIALTMLNVGAIISLRNLPMMASLGLSALFFYLLAALLFFIPTGLICAELAAGWPEEGGVYLWVKEAFGPEVGFMAIWYSWMECTTCFPAILAFMAATAAYLIDPALAENRYFSLCVMLSLFWGATFLNLFGVRISSWVTTVSVICGTVLPAFLIIFLGFSWWTQGAPLALSMNASAFIPTFELDQCVLFAGVLFGFAGLELSAVHATEVKNPQRDYPRAIAFSATLILTLSALGTLAIAAVVPADEVNLVAGVMQAFHYFFEKLGLESLLPVVALLTFIGPFAGICAWIIGPAKGMLPAARAGFLPPSLQQHRNGTPTRLLIVQAIIGSFLSCVFLWMPNVESAYWLLTVWAAQCCLVMYCLVFAAALRLRFKAPHVERPYRIPGGNLALGFMVTLVIATCIGVFLLGLIPPSQLDMGDAGSYVFVVLGGFIVLSMPGLALIGFRMMGYAADRSTHPQFG